MHHQHCHEGNQGKMKKNQKKNDIAVQEDDITINDCPLAHCLNPQSEIRNPKSNRRGAALIAVLSMLIVISLLVASSVTLSQITSYISAETTNRITSAYSAEGAGARAMWLLMNDKKNNPERGLGETPDALDTEERYLADGTKHKMSFNDTDVEVGIYDMLSGISIVGLQPSNTLKRTPDDFKDSDMSYEDYLKFMDCLDDYTDSDMFTRLNGAEEKEYLDLGMPPLPRNGAMKIREEILWIPGCIDFFQPDENGIMSGFQIIPPEGMSNVVGKKSFFSVTRTDMMRECGFDSMKADQVIAARKEWETDKKPLADLLDEEILAKLKEKFSFKESGYYTFIIRIIPKYGKSERLLSFSMKVDSKIGGTMCNLYDWRMF